MIENNIHVVTFPLRMTTPFSEAVSEASKKTPLSKHDWIVEAISEKLNKEQAV